MVSNFDQTLRQIQEPGSRAGFQDRQAGMSYKYDEGKFDL